MYRHVWPWSLHNLSFAYSLLQRRFGFSGKEGVVKYWATITAFAEMEVVKLQLKSEDDTHEDQSAPQDRPHEPTSQNKPLLK